MKDTECRLVSDDYCMTHNGYHERPTEATSVCDCGEWNEGESGNCKPTCSSRSKATLYARLESAFSSLDPYSNSTTSERVAVQRALLREAADTLEAIKAHEALTDAGVSCALELFRRSQELHAKEAEIERLRATLGRIHDRANKAFTYRNIRGADIPPQEIIGLAGDIMQEAGAEIGR